MEVIYGLIPSMIIIGIVLVVILFWAIKSGQFDDLEGDAHRILMDEDLTPMKKVAEKPELSTEEQESQSNSDKQAEIKSRK